MERTLSLLGEEGHVSVSVTFGSFFNKAASSCCTVNGLEMARWAAAAATAAAAAAAAALLAASPTNSS